MVSVRLLRAFCRGITRSCSSSTVSVRCEIITAVPAAAFMLDLAGSRIIYDIIRYVIAPHVLMPSSVLVCDGWGGWLSGGGGGRYSSYWPMISYP